MTGQHSGCEYVGCGRINERENRCSEGGERGLPHAVFVQKWRADEPQAVVCYHGNGGEGYRDGINKEPHQYHGRLIKQGACFSTVILWWTINVAERPFKESHRARRRPDELPLLPLFGENTDSPYFFPYGPGLEIVKLSFQQSSSLLFSFILFFLLNRLAGLAIAKLYQHILEVWRACCMAQGCLCADRDMMMF